MNEQITNDNITGTRTLTRTILDYETEIRSLLLTLARHGCKVISGSNGETRFDNKPGKGAEFIEELLGCDEGWLHVATPELNHFRKGKIAVISLVYGNEPGVVCSGYSCCDSLDNATSEHYDRWKNRKQPTQVVTTTFKS